MRRPCTINALLCATSVFSVSLWLMNSQQKHTTETQRTQRSHREINMEGLCATPYKALFRLLYFNCKNKSGTQHVRSENDPLLVRSKGHVRLESVVVLRQIYQPLGLPAIAVGK